MRAVIIFILAAINAVQFTDAQICGGQVSGVTMTIAAADRFPTASNKDVTVSFTTATFLASGNLVSIMWPAGYLSGTIGVTYSGAANTFATSTSAITNGVTIAVGSAGAAAGMYSVILTGVTLGGPMAAASCGFTVSTTTDSPATGATVAIGGQVTGVGVSIAAVDRIPFATGKSVTVGFTTQTALASGGLVSISFPPGFLTGTIGVTYAGAANTFATSTSAITNGVTVAVGFAGAAVGSYILTLTGATVGGPMAGSASGVTVSTSTDLPATGAIVALGGQVNGVAVSLFFPYSFATGKSVTVSFITQTSLTNGQLVSISFPSGFLTGTIGVTYAGAPNTFAATTTAVGTSVLTIAVGSAGAVPGSYTVTLTGASLPGPTPAGTGTAACGGYNFFVGTTTDLAGVANTPAIGGQVTGVSLTIAVADRVPAATGKSITVSFTTQTALASGQLVTINFPASYIAGSIGVTYAGGANIFSVGTIVTSTTVAIAVGSAGTVPSVAYTVTLTGVTMGNITPGSTSTGVSVSTTADLASLQTGYPGLGGQVTGVSMTIAAADRIPLATGKTVTVSFTTATALLPNQLVTITWPPGYLSGTIGVAFAVANVFSTTTTATGTSGVTIAVGSAGAPGGVVYTITLTGVTMPSPMPAACNVGIWVATTTDLRSVNSVTTQAIGGVVTGVTFAMTGSQRVPNVAAAAATAVVTVGFQLTTAYFTAGNEITINFPSNFFLTSIPTVICTGGAGPSTAVVTFVGTSQFILTTTSAWDTTAKVCTFSNVATGPPTAGNASVTVQSTQDSPSTAVSSGTLGGQVNGVSVSITAADRIPFATGKSVTVGFTTQTSLTNGQLVSISFPSSFLTGTIGVTYAGAPNIFAPITTDVGTSALTIAVGSAGAAPGSYTVTLTGATMPGPAPAATGTAACGGYNFFVGTTTDLAGGANTPAIGGQVVGVSLTIAVADRVPTANGKSVTVSFTTQTALGNLQVVTINFPASYIAGSIGVTYAGGANIFSASTIVTSTTVAITVGSAGAFPGAYTVTLTGVTMGSPTAGNAASGVSVSTNSDLMSAQTGYPALGGAVSGAVLTIATFDRLAAVANRKVIVSFHTASALASGSVITVQLPTGFVTAVTAGAVTGITATAVLSGSNIVLTSTGGIAAGAATVTFCGVTLGSFPTNNMYGVSVVTSMDYTTTCSATGTVGKQGQVTAVSMTIPFANRIAGKTAQSAVFAFTTASALPASTANCNTVNTVIITFPLFFFVSNAGDSCGNAAASLSSAGLTGYTLNGTGTGPSSAATFVFTGTAALPAASFSVTISGLTLGSATPGSDTGITVQTSMDAVSPGSPSGPISGYNVTSVTMPSCQLSSACRDLVIGFSSTAGSIAPGGTLAITFTTPPVSGNPDAFMSGSALITGTLVGNTITLTVNANGGAWAIGISATLTLTGMYAQSTGLQSNPLNPLYVSVGGSTYSNSMMYMPTGTGMTTTTSLSIDRPFPGATNVQATVTFAISNRITAGDVIRIMYPKGFFIGAPQLVGCLGSISSYFVRATGLGTCSTLAVTAAESLSATMGFFDISYTGFDQAAGAQTIIFSGLTLSPTAVPASNTFSVATTQNSCSAGMISTGAIQSCYPGQFLPNSAQGCQPCPVGSYSSSINSFSCSSCPPGQYCLEGASQPCSCLVNTFQPSGSQGQCLSCPNQVVPKTGQATCDSDYATTSFDTAAYKWGFAIFLCIAFLSFTLFVVIFRSRQSFSVRPFHSAICFYVFMFWPYSAFKASAVWYLLTAEKLSEQLVAQLLLNGSFSIYFVLGCGGKLALVQLWMHMIDRHTTAGDAKQTPGEHLAPLNQMMSKAQRTWTYIKRAVVLVSASYSIGFFILVGVFVYYSQQCANQASNFVCLSPSDVGVPAPCLISQQAVKNIDYYEGVWAGVVVVIFSMYTYLFNGIVYAILTQNLDLSSWQRTIMGSNVLQFLLKPFISKDFVKKDDFQVSNELREWRETLRSLGIRLALVSISSFVLKAVLELLALLNFFSNDAGLKFALSTICAEGIPSTITLMVLLRYHFISARQDSKNVQMRSINRSSSDTPMSGKDTTQPVTNRDQAPINEESANLLEHSIPKPHTNDATLDSITVVLHPVTGGNTSQLIGPANHAPTYASAVAPA